jgi:class 3 adenylate cyclase
MTEAPGAIRGWLEGLGLGQHAEAFEAQEIDLEAVADVTEGDLKEMGVPIGPRRKILRAIAALSTPDAAAAEQPARQQDAERRQITVMFCDLVGSTALSEKLDPEDLRSVMQAYQKAAGAVIERYGGHVAQYLGDGLMTYFGWPQAHEDDAERAVRASLEIVEAVGAMDLQVRIGIATGPVVVGETGAGDASVPKLAVGETPNLAARLQGLAGADEIVVGPSTRRLLGGTFELVDMGEQAFKGIVEPVHAHRITGIATTEGRFEAQHQHLTPLVGREAEMAMVMARWDQAKAGEGQVIVLGGEPGIGKSRITQALRERLADEPHTRLRYQCSPYHTNSALHPVIEQLERAAGFERDDGPDRKLDKLEILFPNGAGRSLVASLLSLPVARYPALAMSPQKQKEETLRTLAEGTTALAAAAPVLLIFEDAHWIDPTSQELLDLIVPVVADHRVLAVITHRPEYAPPWTGQSHVAPLSLTRLGRADAAAMVARVSDPPLPDEVLDQIVAKTDGVPLFVEELTKTVVESGAKTATTIPETLQDSLVARLDRLSPVKEVAQIGACIGREFTYELLAAVSPLGNNELNEALQQLVNSELIFRAGATYSFKHALVQDAAYEGLLKSRRQQLHDHIASALEQRFPEIANGQPELVARHLEAAGSQAQASQYRLRHGQIALGRSAIEEAIESLQIGIRDAASIERDDDRAAMEMDLLGLLGAAFMFGRGMASAEADEACAKAAAIAKSNPLYEPARIMPVLWGEWLVQEIGGKANRAIQLAEQMVEIAKDDPRCAVVAHAVLLDANYWLGNIENARDQIHKADEFYDENLDQHQIATYGFDMMVVKNIYASQFTWMLGYPDQALTYKRALDQHVETLDQDMMRAFAFTWGAFVLTLRGDLDEHLAQTERASAICEKFGLAHFTFQADVWHSWHQSMAGSSTSLAQMSDYMDAYRDNGNGAGLAAWLGYFGQAALKLGETDLALPKLLNHREFLLSYGEGVHLAELQRVIGELRCADGETEQAEEDYEAALTLARKQKAKSWELRAATSLSPASGSPKARPGKPTTSWRRSMAGSPRASIPPISRRPRRCWAS